MMHTLHTLACAVAFAIAVRVGFALAGLADPRGLR